MTDVWLEEATEFTQADLEIIDDRLRGELPPGQFYQIRMTFNPVSKNHWIKKVFFDIADPNVLTHQSTYMGNRFIDDAYRARMERRKIVDPEGYRIYGLGEWGEVGGLILSNYVIEEFGTSPERFDYMDEYERKAKRYVKDREFSKVANEEMRIYNLTMKVNRLEMLKAKIGLALVSGHAELEEYMSEILKGRTEDELERQAGILGETVLSNDKKAEAIVNASFHNATFSDRIWMNQNLLKSELSKLLQSGLIQGKNPRVLARDLRKRFSVSISNAERLMRTELTRVQTEAQKQSFERNGFEQYTFLANVGCCPICQRLNGKHFKVKDMMPGKNASPMHPNCRCSTACYEDSEEYEAWLDYLDKGGTTAEWEKLKKSKEKGAFAQEIKRVGTNAVDLGYIKSEQYRRKFNKITRNTSVNNAIRQYATAMLTHRAGTDGEDLYLLNSDTGDLILRKNTEKGELEVSLSKEETNKIKSKYKDKMIGMHNHPTNILPTGSDFTVAGYRGYKFGIVVTHDGRVYKYNVGDKIFTPGIIDNRVDKYTKPPYDLGVEEAHMKALNEIVKEYGISWEELK